MSFVAVTKKDHADLAIKKSARFEFLSKLTLVPISLLDVYTNVIGLPLAFYELNGGMKFVAVCGISPREIFL